MNSDRISHLNQDVFSSNHKSLNVASFKQLIKINHNNIPSPTFSDETDGLPDVCVSVLHLNPWWFYRPS